MASSGCHVGIAWIELLDVNDNILFSACVPNDEIVYITAATDDPSCPEPTPTPTPTPPEPTPTPTSSEPCTIENCDGFPCTDGGLCCGDSSGNCNCCPEPGWVCCPGTIYCAADLGSCP